MTKFGHFLDSFLLVGVTALGSSYFVEYGLPIFYHQLDLPPLTPPDKVFAPVWTVLYLLMIWSFYEVLTAKENPHRQTAVWLFGGQLVLHILWCLLFFRLQWFFAAFVDILALLVLVYLMIRQFLQISAMAAYLQYPYLFWLCFAAYLNLGVVYMNGF